MASTTQQDDLVGQRAASRIDPAGGLEGLADGLGRDNLFQSRQSIQDPARVIGRQRAMSLWHASHGLLVALGSEQTQGNRRL